MKKTTFAILFSILLIFLINSTTAQSEEDGNYLIKGVELEKLLALLNAWIATFLFVLAFMAYKRDGRKRLFYVSLALSLIVFLGCVFWGVMSLVTRSRSDIIGRSSD